MVFCYIPSGQNNYYTFDSVVMKVSPGGMYVIKTQDFFFSK